MISKKRYWGLALPIYVCEDCGAFEVIGSREELRSAPSRAGRVRRPHAASSVGGRCQGRCRSAAALASRVPDVGNPWLDAGIVPFSTLHYRHDRELLARVVSSGLHHRELSGPVPQLVLLDAGDGRRAGRHCAVQERCWASPRCSTSTARRCTRARAIASPSTRRPTSSARTRCAGSTPPTRRSRTCASRASPARRRLRRARAKGQPPRLNDLWLQARAPLDKLWNVYSFFVTYANIDGFNPTTRTLAVGKRSDLDRWVLSELQETVRARDGASWSTSTRSALWHGAGVVHRESLELVRAPEPPPLLEERGGRRQGRRLPDALRVPGDGDEATGAADAVPGGVALPESRALGGCTARPKACISATGR